MRADRRQQGFVLVSVLLIALLYFGLIELLLTDSSRALRESSRFRARISANILVDNGAELAAAGMTGLPFNSETLETDQGSMTGTFRRVGQNHFLIEASGTSHGVIRNTRKIEIRGRIEGKSVVIDEIRHDD